MKPRRVEVMIEAESNLAISELKMFYKNIKCSGDEMLEPLEVRVNVIKELKKKKRY